MPLCGLLYWAYYTFRIELMLPLKIRLKIFNKLAQEVPGAPASPTSPTTPAEPASTTGAHKTPSQPASAMINLATGWTNWAQPINKIVDKVDAAIIAGTGQKYNFNDLFQNRFPSGIETEFPPPDPTKDIIRFAKLIYQYMLNNGRPYSVALRHSDMRSRVNALLSAPELQKFQQVNIKGPLKNLGIDLSSLRSDLLSLYNSIPAT